MTFLNYGMNVLEAAKNTEIEQVLIVKPVDFNEIKKISFKDTTMEQWEVKSENADLNGPVREGRGSIRVRVEDNKKYTLTSKSYNIDGISATEVEQPTTKEMFDVFKKICPMGSKKTRYHIRHQGVIFEVDVYYKKNGKEVEWCKVDIELDSRRESVPPLPFAVQEEPIGVKRTPKQEAFVTNLFKKEFQMYNEDSIHPLDIGK